MALISRRCLTARFACWDLFITVQIGALFVGIGMPRYPSLSISASTEIGEYSERGDIMTKRKSPKSCPRG